MACQRRLVRFYPIGKCQIRWRAIQDDRLHDFFHRSQSLAVQVSGHLLVGAEGPQILLLGADEQDASRCFEPVSRAFANESR